MGVIVKNGIWYCGGDGSGNGGGENEYKTLLSLEDGIITAPSSGTQYTQETVLQEFTLQDDINNYDQILIKNHVGPHYWNNQADLINESILYPKLYDGSMFTLGEPSFDDVNYYILMQVSIDKNKLKVHFNVKNNFDYSKIEIFGVKISGSNSSGSVLPSKVELKETTIFDAMSSPADASENYYSLTDNYDNYDMLEIFYHSSYDHNNTGELNSSLFTVAELKENNLRTFYGYANRFIGILFDKENTKQFKIPFNGANGEDSDKKWLLYKIVGIKFNGGGSSSGDSTEGLTDEQLAALASETIAAAWPQ